jgi:hypothetical protein
VPVAGGFASSGTREKKAIEEDSGRSLCDLRIGFRENILSFECRTESTCGRVMVGGMAVIVLTVVEVLRTGLD